MRVPETRAWTCNVTLACPRFSSVSAPTASIPPTATLLKALVARKRSFLGAEWSRRWDQSYQKLTHEQQKGADKVVIALSKQRPTPGMRVKPVEPQKYHYEARINDGDRVIYRVEAGKVWFVDVVVHDDITVDGSAVAEGHRRHLAAA